MGPQNPPPGDWNQNQNPGQYGGQPYDPYTAGQNPNQPYQQPAPQDPYAQNPYGDTTGQQFAQDPYTTDPSAAQQYSTQPYSSQPYSTQPYSAQPYSADPYAQPYPAQPDPMMQQGYNPAMAGGQAPQVEKAGMSTGVVIAIIAAAVLLLGGLGTAGFFIIGGDDGDKKDSSQDDDNGGKEPEESKKAGEGGEIEARGVDFTADIPEGWKKISSCPRDLRKVGDRSTTCIAFEEDEHAVTIGIAGEDYSRSYDSFADYTKVLRSSSYGEEITYGEYDAVKKTYKYSGSITGAIDLGDGDAVAFAAAFPTEKLGEVEDALEALFGTMKEK